MLEMKNVVYYYKSQKDKVILNHISYCFESGKMYAILGASGSGKTTLLSLLADEPTGNLDENTAKEIIAIFSELAQEQKKCVIIVTHSKELAQNADVVLTLRNGTIILDAEG